MNHEAFLSTLGAGEDEIPELLEYNKNRFCHKDAGCFDGTPVKDELFAIHWENEIAAIPQKGILKVLRDNFIQFNFPVAAGMSRDEEYLFAVRRGLVHEDRKNKDWLSFEAPDRIKLYLYRTYAGAIPVIYTADRRDFILLIQTLTMRNEPADIPDSMGACMVKGYNNWTRIADYKSKLRSDLLWNMEKESFFSQKELYQDRFIILSDGGYSGISAKTMGLSEEEWKSRSLVIRLEHEGVHYFTERLLGASNANIFDEFIADYAGIRKAFGRYKAEWFLSFMGLEAYPSYRSGGRLENYKGRPPLSDKSFTVLQRIVKKAAMHLEKFELQNPSMKTLDVLLLLTKATLLDIASDDYINILQS